MKKLFLFDFDGVIADSMELYKATTRRCFEKIGKPITPTHDDFLDLFDENFYEAINRRGVSVEEFNAAAALIVPHVDYSGVTAFDGLIPVLGELRREHTLLIISSNNSHAITAILSRINHNGCFDAILGADFMLSKVDKIFHAMEKWKMPGDRTYFIGDTTGDIKEAKAAGVITVAVTWGWHSKERLRRVNPDYLIDSPGELLGL